MWTFSWQNYYNYTLRALNEQATSIDNSYLLQLNKSKLQIPGPTSLWKTIWAPVLPIAIPSRSSSLHLHPKEKYGDFEASLYFQSVNSSHWWGLSKRHPFLHLAHPLIVCININLYKIFIIQQTILNSHIQNSYNYSDSSYYLFLWKIAYAQIRKPTHLN